MTTPEMLDVMTALRNRARPTTSTCDDCGWVGLFSLWALHRKMCPGLCTQCHQGIANSENGLCDTCYGDQLASRADEMHDRER